MMMGSAEETTTEEEEVAAATTDVMCCASCGTPAVDDVKLKKCACGLVKYCSDVCQETHREQHEEECMKRLAEIRDKDLFTMPDESHLGDCSICCLPLPLDQKKTTLNDCCSQLICNGCNYANMMREYEAGLERRCAYCREPFPKTKEEGDKRSMKRIKKNCPVAMREMGRKRYREGDYGTAFEYLTKAADLGDAGAHYALSCMYHKGDGVEKDMKEQVYHAEQAAIGGHPNARFNLGYYEFQNGRFKRAVKHLIIAANLGYHDSLEGLRHLYADGHATKEEYANALRAYQAAVDATKSSEREKAEAYYEAMDAAHQS
jgi:hypothetical protein